MDETQVKHESFLKYAYHIHSLEMMLNNIFKCNESHWLIYTIFHL